MTESYTGRAAAVFAANAQLEVRAGAAALLDGNLPQLAHAGQIRGAAVLVPDL